MRVDLSQYRAVPKTQIRRYWKLKRTVYAYVHEKNPWVSKGFYDLWKTPLIWRNAMFDILSCDEVDFVVRKEE